jgi:hypothetical protein
MNAETPSFKETIGPWVPFGFCVFLCGLVMFILVTTGKIEAAYPAFFCFLPMTFFFVAVAVVQIGKELKRLSDRIDQLEKREK